VIGDRLRSRTDNRRATEVDVAVHALNRMLELGDPNYVRTARPCNTLSSGGTIGLSGLRMMAEQENQGHMRETPPAWP
jgi:hypothetical protein